LRFRFMVCWHLPIVSVGVKRRFEARVYAKGHEMRSRCLDHTRACLEVAGGRPRKWWGIAAANKSAAASVFLLAKPPRRDGTES
jgi:hypothetical protein